MATEINDKGLINWCSERFGKETMDTNPNLVFFEDDDPRIVLVEDVFGDPCWIIGYSRKIMLPNPREDVTSTGGGVIVLRVRDYSTAVVDHTALKSPSV